MPVLRLAAVLLVAALVAGCRGGPVRPDAGSAAGMPDLEVAAGAVASSTGCMLDYTLYRPQQAVTDALVILGHGFLRSREHMAGLAATLAGRGVPTVTLDFCNMRFWDGNHVQNGADMVRLARHLGATATVYAGFSAGGLAAVVAGRQDEATRGVVALDLVDQDAIGVTAASGLEAPLVGLVGEPSSCNADNNGLAVYDMHARAEVIPVPGATHCDFETPTDGLCRLVCESGQRPSGASPRPRIVELTTGAVAGLLGLAPLPTASAAPSP